MKNICSALESSYSNLNISKGNLAFCRKETVIRLEKVRVEHNLLPELQTTMVFMFENCSSTIFVLSRNVHPA